MSTSILIDPPGAYAPMGEWEDYLDELRASPVSPEVTAAIEDAEKWVAIKKAAFSAGDDPLDEDDFSDLEGNDEGEA